MQFINILLAFLGDFTRNGLIACNLIPILPGILECKYIFVQFSSNINISHIIKICIKIVANCTFNDPFRLRNKDFTRSFEHADLNRCTLPGISFQRPLN